jgi:excinuclease ABC subunit B
MKKKPNFTVISPYQPAGDQPKAIEVLTKSILDGVKEDESVKITSSI